MYKGVHLCIGCRVASCCFLYGLLCIAVGICAKSFHGQGGYVSYCGALAGSCFGGRKILAFHFAVCWFLVNFAVVYNWNE